jgi:hypothetical protein
MSLDTFRSPPPPIAPPPSRETDYAFGVVLILTGFLILGLVVVVFSRQTRTPVGEKTADDNSSTTYKSDRSTFTPSGNADGDNGDTDAFKLSMKLPTVVLRPL